MRSSEAGYSLAETLVATAVMMGVSGVVTSALMQMSKSQATIWNRTEMHSGVRSATELLQQEVGQAGRISLPMAISTGSAVAVAGRTVTLTSTNGIFVGELLTVGAGSLAGCATDCQEVVKVAGVTSTQITADNAQLLAQAQVTPGFLFAHASGTPVSVQGAFANGIVPSSVTAGSDGYHLKLFGDINSDGSMLYIEYTCDTAAGFLYRNVMNFDQAPPKPAVGAAQVLLSNIVGNPLPPGSSTIPPCFTYQTQTVTSGTPPVAYTYVTDVAITLTVQTQVVDPITRKFETETKALLNVSPRNVVNAWALGSANVYDHIQVTPPTVTALLPE